MSLLLFLYVRLVPFVSTVGVALCGHPSGIYNDGWPQRATPTFISAMYMKVLVVWIDCGGHLQVTVGLPVGTESLVNDSGLVKKSRVLHA